MKLYPCRRGHARTPDNLRVYLREDGGYRFVCKSCVRITTGEWKRYAYRHDPEYRKLQCTRARKYQQTKRSANVPT